MSLTHEDFETGCHIGLGVLALLTSEEAKVPVIAVALSYALTQFTYDHSHEHLNREEKKEKLIETLSQMYDMVANEAERLANESTDQDRNSQTN